MSNKFAITKEGDALIAEQDWNDSTLLSLALDFITKLDEADKFMAHLREFAEAFKDK